MRTGGAGANAALAFAEAGITVRLIGCVGEDHIGRWMQEQLEPLGWPANWSCSARRPAG